MRNYFKTLLILLAILYLPCTVNAKENRIAVYQMAGYEIYNVVSYGADTSGKADSSAAINKAVADCQKEPGGVLYFPPGKYRSSTPIMCRWAIEIVAEESAEIEGEGNAVIYIKTSVGGETVVSGGTWKGKKTGGSGICIDQGSRARLEEVVVKDAYNGIRATQAEVVMNKCKVKNNKNFGAVLYQNTKAVIQGSGFSGNGSGYPKIADKGHGIGVYDGSSLNIKDSTVEKSAQCGITLVGTTVEVENCRLTNNGRHGIGTRDKCKVTAKNTTFKHNGYRKSEVVFGNHGMIVVDGTKAVVEGCNFVNNKNQGIWVNGGGSSLIAKKTTFDQNGMTPMGISSDKGKVKVTLESCTFKNCQDGIQVTLTNKGTYELKFKGKNKFKDATYRYWVDKNGKRKYVYE